MLDAALDKAITAARRLAPNTGVARVVVVVFTFLIACGSAAASQADLVPVARSFIIANRARAGTEIVSNMTVTAPRRATIVEAAIGLFFVAIITLLKTRLTIGDVSTLYPVAASSGFTAVGASIGGNSVVIVALLLRIDDTIAATFDTAIRAAAVTDVLVPVVTRFEAFICCR